MAKIGVYGGTFNPIHNGHIHLMAQFSELLGLDKILLIPTAIPPHKTPQHLAKADDRLAMCRIAAGSQPNVDVSDIEICRSGKSYTSDTLKSLHKRFPNDSLFLLMGEDMFLTIDDWHNPQEIYSLAKICAAPRSNYGLQRLQKYAEFIQKKGAECYLCKVEYLPISSTMVREAAENRSSLQAMVPAGVAHYIQEHALYKKPEEEIGL